MIFLKQQLDQSLPAVSLQRIPITQNEIQNVYMAQNLTCPLLTCLSTHLLSFLPYSHCSSHISPLTSRPSTHRICSQTQYLCNWCLVCLDALCPGSYMAGFTIHLTDTSSTRPFLMPQPEGSPFPPNTLHHITSFSRNYLAYLRHLLGFFYFFLLKS